MAASTWRSSQPSLQSISPSSSRFCSRKTQPSFSSTSPTTFAYSSSPKPFSTVSPFPYPAASPATPSAATSPASTPTARFSLVSTIPDPKRTCLCSPSTHPGAFRCKFHRKTGNGSSGQAQAMAPASASRRLNMARFAIMNSVARNRIVRGDLVKRVFTALVRPSSPQQCRCRTFRLQPSRLSVMSKV